MSHTIPQQPPQGARDAAPQLTVRARTERRGSVVAGSALVWDAPPRRRRGEAFAVVRQRLSW